MRTLIVIRYCGKPSFRHEENRRLNEDEVHAIIVEGLAGRDEADADINVYHDYTNKIKR